jgi:hypothetical protein
VKKTNTQFVVVFAGVLMLHLAATTALMKSAHTDGSGLITSTPDPYYHSSPDEPERSPGWGAAESQEAQQNPIAPPAIHSELEKNGNPSESIPDAFVDAAPSAESTTGGQVGVGTKAPPVREKPPPSIKKIEPAPDAPIRRLTVTQLLTPEPPIAPEDDATAKKSPGTTSVPKVKPLPPVTRSNSGPRKIRSLSGD